MSEFPAPWGNYLIEELVPTMTPQLVSAWPQTLAWKLLAIIFVCYLLKKSYLAWRNYQRNAYRREGLAWLCQLPTYTSMQEQNIYRQLPALIRKTALQAFGRDEVSPLSNEHWERWLDQQCDKTSFADQHTQLLQTLAYASEPKIDPQKMQALLSHIRLWIQFHRRSDD